MDSAQRVAALIFNGLSKGLLADGPFVALSARARIADAVYDELVAGGVEVRVAARARIADAVYDELVAGGVEVRVADGGHEYLSTGCLHGDHGYCSAGTKLDGRLKLPARCKFCEAPCRCPCHKAGADDPEAGPCVGICAGCTPDCHLVGDSCSCTKAGPDPGCVVHQGRRARGPKPPPVGEGCICDGSGRTCPRHGAVI